jgi:hypothetical protein
MPKMSKLPKMIKIKDDDHFIWFWATGIQVSPLRLPGCGGQAGYRSYLKKVFWPNLFVGASFQVLEILMYSCGLKLGSASIFNQNPFFEMASS